MQKDTFQLSGQVAMVTGAGSGIGQGIAVGLAEAGADIVAVYHSSVDETQKSVQALGRRFLGIQADLSKMESIPLVMEAALGAFGRIDILVNNAGYIYREPALQYPEAEWDSVMDINAKIVFFLSQAVARQMVERNIQGSIINIASLMSYLGGVFVPAYTASKAAIRGLTMLMSNEWAKHGIRVNALAPGWIQTKMTRAVQDNESRNEEILSRIPAGRWGNPEDFKGPAVFLASAASAYVSGVTIPVDGGYLGK